MSTSSRASLLRLTIVLAFLVTSCAFSVAPTSSEDSQLTLELSAFPDRLPAGTDTLTAEIWATVTQGGPRQHQGRFRNDCGYHYKCQSDSGRIGGRLSEGAARPGRRATGGNRGTSCYYSGHLDLPFRRRMTACLCCGLSVYYVKLTPPRNSPSSVCPSVNAPRITSYNII